MSSSRDNRPKQQMLVLCGWVGSGKSTFARAFASAYPKFVRCNQDELGKRPQVEALARQALAAGASVIIDRTNFDPPQRRTWLEIAAEHSDWVEVSAIVFDTSFEECEDRLRLRTGHQTLKTPEKALDVHRRFSRSLRNPKPQEGFSRIIHVKSSELSIRPTFQELEAIAGRLASSTFHHHDSLPRPPPPSPNRGGRGRGRGRGSNRGSSGSPRNRNVGREGGSSERFNPYSFPGGSSNSDWTSAPPS